MKKKVFCLDNYTLLKNNELGSVKSHASFFLALRRLWPLAPMEEALAVYTATSLNAHNIF